MNPKWKGRRVFRGKNEAGNNITLVLDAEIRPDESYDWEETDRKVALDVLAISGSIFEGRVVDKNCFSAGQCYDSIEPSNFKEADLIQKIIDVWKEWHLNGTLAGDKAQEEALAKFYANNPKVKQDYDHAVAFLKSAELHDHNGYVYGTKWLGKPVPQDVINFVKDTIAGDEEKYEDEC